MHSDNIITKTLRVAKSIDATFFKLKHAYNALMLGEFFVEIIKLNGKTIQVDFESEDYDGIKNSIIQELAEIDNTTLTEEQSINVAFYLGLICSTLTHGNIPLPNELTQFGRVEADEKDLD